MTPDDRVARLARFYEQLSPRALDGLGTYYAEDAFFKDPFNEVRGVAAIRAIFEHMYAALHEPRFVVTQTLAQGDDAFLTWDFHFGLGRGAPLTVRGATHLRFDAQDRVILHRDYWDAAEELYEKLPVLGSLMRWLRRRVARSR